MKRSEFFKQGIAYLRAPRWLSANSSGHRSAGEFPDWLCRPEARRHRGTKISSQSLSGSLRVLLWRDTQFLAQNIGEYTECAYRLRLGVESPHLIDA